MFGFTNADPTIKPEWGAELDRSHPLARGLVAAFALNEGTGRTVNDVAAARVGSLNSGVSWSAGRVGACLSVDGLSGYALESSVPATTATYSVACWFRPDDTARRMICSHDDGTNVGWRLQTASATAANPTLSLGSVAEYPFTNFTTASGVWQFFAVTVAGTAAVGYFATAGGALKSQSLTIGSAIGTPDRFTISSPLFSSGFIFSGKIDHAWLYDRTLTSDEVSALAFDPYAMFLAPATRRFLAPAVVVGGPAIATGAPLLMSL